MKTKKTLDSKIFTKLCIYSNTKLLKIYEKLRGDFESSISKKRQRTINLIEMVLTCRTAEAYPEEFKNKYGD